MLKALPNVRQVRGEPRRRWYFCHEQDLVVFEDDAGKICGFQLAYDKLGQERSLSWQAGRGYASYRVADGEETALASNTPLLHACAEFDRERVLQRFLNLAGELPPHIGDFVTAKLRAYDGSPAP